MSSTEAILFAGILSLDATCFLSASTAALPIGSGSGVGVPPFARIASSLAFLAWPFFVPRPKALVKILPSFLPKNPPAAPPAIPPALANDAPSFCSCPRDSLFTNASL